MDIILYNVGVEEDYGIGRKFWRVTEIRELNVNVTDTMIRTTNQWYKIKHTKVTHTILIIIEHSANIMIMLDTIL